ncbi:MAG: alpha/beta fold hydrolase [Pyrinomonadaceae bacterium]
MNIKTLTTALLLFLFCGYASAQSSEPKKIHVNGMDLTYIESGHGETVILLHGGQGDHRSWQPQMDLLSKSFRVISYSRRYHYPNDNPITSDYHSAYTEADDLDALIRALRIKKVHLIGVSIGAFVALKYAVDHPKTVASLVLAEPPVHQWIKDTPAGLAVYDEFMTKTWKPAGDAFRSGNDVEAVRILVDTFGGAGAFDRMPPAAKAAAMANSRFFKAATDAADPFPNLSKEKVRRLKMPILIVRGENTIEIHKRVNAELEKLLPAAQSVIIPRAGHGSARDNPVAFNQAVGRFLSSRMMPRPTPGK